MRRRGSRRNMQGDDYEGRTNSESIKLQKSFIKEEQMKELQAQVKQLYLHIFNEDKSKIELKNFIKLNERKTKLPQCNKNVRYGQQFYTCYDCESGQNTLICRECFENGNHLGHRFQKKYLYGDGGGICDCGNEMMIKKQGFCCNHSGKPQQIEILKEQRDIFMKYFKILFNWLSLLKGQGQQRPFSELIITFLSGLIDNSVYYIRLLSDLLIKEKEILQDWVQVEKNMVNRWVQVMQKLMVYDDMKEELIIQLINTYNKGDKQQQSLFHNILFQLIQNNQYLIDKMCEQNRMVIIKPQADNFNFWYYFQFLISIALAKQSIAINYFKQHFKEGIIDFPYYLMIEKQVQTKNIQIFQILSNSFTNDIQYYYNLCNQIVSKCHECKELMSNMVKSYISIIRKQTYKHNKIVLQYHRVLGMGLFALYDGNIQEITLKSIIDKLQLNMSQLQLEQFFKDNGKIVLKCILQYAQTYAKNSYFNNYFQYNRIDQLSLFNYDTLFLRVVSAILANNKTNLLQQFREIYNEQSQQSLQETQKMNKWISYVSLITQVVVSNKTDILFNNKLGIKNKGIMQEQQCLMRQLVNVICPIPHNKMKEVGQIFFSELKEDLITKYLIYQKETKKFNIKHKHNKDSSEKKQLLNQEEHDESIGRQQFRYEYYPSIKKLNSCLFLNITHKNHNNKVMKVDKKTHKIGLGLVMNNIIDEILDQLLFLFKFGNDKQYVTIRQNIQTQLHKLKALKLYDEQALQDMYGVVQEMREYGMEQEYQEKLQTNKINKTIKNAKLEKLKMKQKKYLEEKVKSPNKEKQQQMEQQEQCIICRQYKQEQKLFSLGYISKSNIFNYKIGVKEDYLYFKGCLHLVHPKCVQSNTNRCPLCKSLTNIYLPYHNSKYKGKYPEEFFKQMVDNISKKGKIDNNIQTVFNSILQSYNELICLQGIYNYNRYDTHFKYIGKSLFIILEYIWKTHEEVRNPKQQHISHSTQACTILTSMSKCISTAIVSQLKDESKGVQNYKEYVGKINRENLQIVIKCLSSMFNHNPETILQSIESQYNGNKQAQVKFVSKVQQIIQFYKPPSVMSDVLTYRNSIQLNCKKSNHVVGICLLCHDDYCLDCDVLKVHAFEQHAQSMIFFNLYTGGLIYQVNNNHYIISSFYKNKLMEKWKFTSKPQNYYFDQEEYHEIINKFMSHTFEEEVKNY